MIKTAALSLGALSEEMPDFSPLSLCKLMRVPPTGSIRKKPTGKGGAWACNLWGLAFQDRAGQGN